MKGIYVIAPLPEGPCKIGIAVKVLERVKGLQTGSWAPLYVGYFGFFADPLRRNKAATGGAYRLERLVHKRLTGFDLQLAGEWFDISVADATAVIRKCADLDGLKEITPEVLTQVAGAYGDTLSRAQKSLMEKVVEGRMAWAKGAEGQILVEG